MRYAILLLLALAACADVPDALLAPDGGRRATAHSARYVVTVTGDPHAIARSHGVQPDHVYTHALRGFAAALPDAALDGLRRSPHVTRIERDWTVEARGVASWGLDRIDQRALPMDGVFAPPGDGAGVDVYIIDTGIRYTHSEFGGRARFGFDAFGEGGADCHGHGTHVAGTVGGATFGVARGVGLVAVRVLNCDGMGMLSGVVAGLDYVAGQSGLRVANLSLGGGRSTTMNDAVAGAVAAGVVVVVAAGNNSGDACNLSPASAPPALTVAATTSTDTRASFSAWGACVDLFAPGVAIQSAYHASDGATASMSGTSMASPHVAGVAALVHAQLPSASAPEVSDSVVAYATSGVVKDANGSPDRLAYIEPGDAPPPPDDPPPPDPEPTYDPPTGLQADVVQSGQGKHKDVVVRVRWATPEGAVRVRVYRDGLALHDAVGDEWTDRGVGRGSTYTYAVAALYPDGVESEPTAPVSVTVCEPVGKSGKCR